MSTAIQKAPSAKRRSDAPAARPPTPAAPRARRTTPKNTDPAASAAPASNPAPPRPPAAAPAGPPLSEAALCAMPEADYMNAAQLEFFRARLNSIAEDLVANDVTQGAAMRENEQAADPVDRASQEESHSMGLLTRHRDTQLYAEVRQALARIDSGEFGYCQETGDPIGLPRLLARPTALFTVDIQQRREVRSRTHAA